MHQHRVEFRDEIKCIMMDNGEGEREENEMSY